MKSFLTAIASTALLTAPTALAVQELPSIGVSPDVLAVRSSSTSPSPLAMSMQDVPRNIRRIMAQHLEDVRQNMPGWEDVQPTGVVHPFFRPDVQGPAYYEFDLSPAGFIVMSTGRHDIPICHWSNEGDSMAEILIAGARGIGKQARRLYKMDTFFYVAEGAGERIVAELGPWPAKIEHLALGRSGSSEGKDLVRSYWADWQELKYGYEDNYGLLLDQKRDRASSSWEIEERALTEGQHLQPGLVQPIGLIGDLRGAELLGQGADLVELVHGQDDAGRPQLAVRQIAEAPSGAGYSLELVLHYAGGEVDVHQLIAGGNGGSHTGAGASEEGGTILHGSWSNWQFRFAGDPDDQPVYNQFTFGNGCAVGCGPVAWSMLLAWCDNQADAGNPRWAPRWGIYRQNGQTAPAPNAVVPLNQNVASEGMMIQIGNSLDTYCTPWGTATLPGDMDGVNGYLAPRTGAEAEARWEVYDADYLRVRAMNQVWGWGTPAVIGTGFFQHYALAWGYAWRTHSSGSVSRWFLVNQGWGGAGDAWIPAETWFCGELWTRM